MSIPKCQINKQIVFVILGIGFILSGLTPHSVLANPQTPVNAVPKTAQTTVANLLTVKLTLDSTILMVGRPFLLYYEIANVSQQTMTVSTNKLNEGFITFRFLRPDEAITASTTLAKVRRWLDVAMLSPTGSEQTVRNKVVVKDWSQNIRPGDYIMEMTFHLRARSTDGSSLPTSVDITDGDVVTYVCRTPVTVLPQDVLQLRKEVRQLQQALSRDETPAGSAPKRDVWALTTLFFAYSKAVAYSSWRDFFVSQNTPYYMRNTAAEVIATSPSPKFITLLGEIGWLSWPDAADANVMKGTLRRIHANTTDKALKRLVEKQFIDHEGSWSPHPPLIAAD